MQLRRHVARNAVSTVSRFSLRYTRYMPGKSVGETQNAADLEQNYNATRVDVQDLRSLDRTESFSRSAAPSMRLGEVVARTMYPSSTNWNQTYRE